MAVRLEILRWRPPAFGSVCALLVLAGCGMGQGPAPEAPPAVNRIMDPVAAFAAGGGGGEQQVLLPDTGESAKLRMVRQYAAASGRECREVRVSTRNSDQSRLFCLAGGGWIEARPLLTAARAQP